MRVLLDHGVGFLTINSKINDYGHTPLHVLCGGGRSSVEAISFLVSRGSDINALDNKGRTCLHSYLQGYRYSRLDYIREARDVLVYLLNHGANPRAVDNSGKSVSDTAYGLSFRSIETGDLWDAALIDAGYNHEEFRRGWPRVAVWYAIMIIQGTDLKNSGMGGSISALTTMLVRR